MYGLFRQLSVMIHWAYKTVLINHSYNICCCFTSQIATTAAILTTAAHHSKTHLPPASTYISSEVYSEQKDL